MTARNMQDEVKKKGLPWSAVKGFDTFTPIGSAYSPASPTPFFALTVYLLRNFIPKSAISDPHHLRLALKVTYSKPRSKRDIRSTTHFST